MFLTTQERLRDLREERGLKLEQLAQQTGLSSSALGSYETDETKDISLHALKKLADFYGVTISYILARSELKRHPDADLDDLRLGDRMVELLKAGRVNTAMLCELALHKDFVKLLADIEIYVNGIAAMQIQNLNAWVDVARAEIMEKYRPGEHDGTMLLLNAAHIEEGEYFSRRVHDDIDEIMADIKEAHKTRSESAPDTSVVDELKRDIDEAASFKGSRLEQLIFLFCKQPKIRYNKLTEEEKQWLVRIAQKSELAKGGASQRGKRKK